MKSPFIKLTKELKAHKFYYVLLFGILVAAAFLRLYKLDQLLGFWYDQGRDALVIWKLLHEGKFFLIGPVTGIEGVFLGPFYYYLLTPFYFVGQGSPIFVSIVLNLISVFGIFLLYKVTKAFFDYKVALLTSFLTTFSFSLISFSRWLSHPPLLPTFSLVVIYGLLKIYQGKSKWWLVVGLFLGLCLQLEAAGAIFFLPTIFVFVLLERKKIKNWLLALGGLFMFFSTLVPQAIFNLRHNGVLTDAFKQFLIGEKSFQPPLFDLINKRLVVYLDVFFSKFFYDHKNLDLILFITLLLILFIKRKQAFKNERKILWLWLFIPLVGYLFYQGNNGFFWDYYLSGIWLIFVMLTVHLILSVWSHFLGKILFVLFLGSFLYINIPLISIYYKTGIGITIRNQLQVIDWVYQDAEGENFNVDVYVPPVIPYAYDYLFKWYGKGKYEKEPSVQNVPILYTLSEPDGEHPQFLSAWFKRQNGIGRIIKETKLGDITVQRRERW